MTQPETSPETLAQIIDKANPNDIADALRRVKLGTMLTPLKRAFTGLVAAASHDLTAIDGTDEVVGEANPNRRPVLRGSYVRVTAATTATFVGTYLLADVGATMLTPATSSVVGVARLSDDGTTITFPVANVTAFVIDYIPRADEDIAAEF